MKNLNSKIRNQFLNKIIAFYLLGIFIICWGFIYQYESSTTKTKFKTLPSKYNLEFNISKISILNSNIKIQKIEFYNEPYFELTDMERKTIEDIVTGEAGNQPYEGKVAVANCILNAWLKEQTTLNEVLDKYGYKIWTSLEKFEMECMEAYGNTDLADEVRAAVSQVFDEGDILNEEILWFYAPKYSNGSWHQTQKFVVEISNHRFYAPWN